MKEIQIFNLKSENTKDFSVLISFCINIQTQKLKYEHKYYICMVYAKKNSIYSK